MSSPASGAWDRFASTLCRVPELELSLDVSRMRFGPDFLEEMEPAIQKAFRDMEALEAGAIANPDENRMVGHYWLRAPQLAPSAELTQTIQKTIGSVQRFATEVHAGRLRPPSAPAFRRVLSIGIGGSALGPMFVADALGQPGADKMDIHFIDNTDPDGIARELKRLQGALAETLVLVISKSGGTPETRNGMLVVKEAYDREGLEFARHAVAITGMGSTLDQQAIAESWVARFPMWDWIGGRTSETSVVGLLPAALQGLDTTALLEGAAACDVVTRQTDTARNPAALMALMWWLGADARGAKDLVVLPYKDRLLLLSRYLQQLVMESLGKALDLKGHKVEQGLTVYGNKGSTDQHAYVQQLRDGVPNFFVTFIRVLESGGGAPERVAVEEGGIDSGDFLHGFLLGTRAALAENGRQSMTITVPRVDARTVGVLIALFERAVGLYASLVGINAYHQPGVEAGKKAAAAVLEVQKAAANALTDAPQTAPQIAQAIGRPEAAETTYLVLEHLAANGRAYAQRGASPAEDLFLKASAEPKRDECV